MKVLLIQSSPRGKDSVSRKLTEELLARLRGNGALELKERDLSVSPLPHLGQEQLTAFFTPPASRTPEQAEAARLSDEAVEELLAADLVLISAPIWNFSVPSVLKAWIDHIVRVGRTFSYSEEGLKSLIPPGKKVIVIAASGSVLSSGPMDFLEPYLRAVFGFIGLTHITFVRAEGLSDPRFKDSAYSKAQERILEIA